MAETTVFIGMSMLQSHIRRRFRFHFQAPNLRSPTEARTARPSRVVFAGTGSSPSLRLSEPRGSLAGEVKVGGHILFPISISIPIPILFLQDCKKTFPTALCLGGSLQPIISSLSTPPVNGSNLTIHHSLDILLSCFIHCFILHSLLHSSFIASFLIRCFIHHSLLRLRWRGKAYCHGCLL